MRTAHIRKTLVAIATFIFQFNICGNIFIIFLSPHHKNTKKIVKNKFSVYLFIKNIMATKKITLNELRNLVKQIIKEEKNPIRKKIVENFASNDFYKKSKNDAVKFLKQNDYNWVTVEYDETYNTVRIYQGSGLDPQRDDIDNENMDNYMEMQGHEVLDMIKNGVQPILMEI